MVWYVIWSIVYISVMCICLKIQTGAMLGFNLIGSWGFLVIAKPSFRKTLNLPLKHFSNPNLWYFKYCWYNTKNISSEFKRMSNFINPTSQQRKEIVSISKISVSKNEKKIEKETCCNKSMSNMTSITKPQKKSEIWKETSRGVLAY